MIEVNLDNVECASFSAADAWARESCAGYVGLRVVDVSDFYDADEIAVYSFTNTADAAFFTMTWKAVK
jgi:hypothetical protein